MTDQKQLEKRIFCWTFDCGNAEKSEEELECIRIYIEDLYDILGRIGYLFLQQGQTKLAIK